MQHININDNSWHWRFIKFVGNHRRILYDPDHQNTCSYVTTFLVSAVTVAFWATLVFLFAMNTAFNLIVSAIFCYYLGPSLQALQFAAQALPPGLEFFYTITATLAAVFGGALALLGAGVILVRTAYRGITKLRYSEAVHRIQSTDGYAIVSAWHNRICRPITINRVDK